MSDKHTVSSTVREFMGDPTMTTQRIVEVCSERDLTTTQRSVSTILSKLRSKHGVEKVPERQKPPTVRGIIMEFMGDPSISAAGIAAIVRQRIPGSKASRRSITDQLADLKKLYPDEVAFRRTREDGQFASTGAVHWDKLGLDAVNTRELRRDVKAAPNEKHRGLMSITRLELEDASDG